MMCKKRLWANVAISLRQDCLSELLNKQISIQDCLVSYSFKVAMVGIISDDFPPTSEGSFIGI